MDLAVYIGELLRQHGSLSVPGLGRFSQVSKEGYYAENEGRFYPPHHETGFEEQAAADETLANYLSSRKNISVNSAKYFIDKYVNQLKQNAAADEVSMDQLGWMGLVDGRLQFRPNTAATTFEGDFFGLPSIQVNKIWEQLSGYKPPVVAEPAAPAQVVQQSSSPAPTPELAIFPEVLNLASDTPEPARREREPVRKQEPAAAKQPANVPVATEPAAPKAAVNVWILVLIIVTLAGIILLALYNYKPSLFSTRGSGNIHAPAGTKHTAADTVSTHQPDTIQTSLSTTRTDTASKAAAPVKDTVAATKPAPVTTKPAAPAADTAAKAAAYVSPASQYQIAGGAFKTQKEVDQAIAAYRSLGITAHTLRPNRPGNKIKVTLGGFNTYEEAQARLNQLKAAHKTIKDAYIIRPNTK